MPVADGACVAVALVHEGQLLGTLALGARDTRRSFTREETEKRLVYELGAGQWNIPRLRTLLEEILPKNSRFVDFEVECDFPGIGPRTMLLHARKLRFLCPPAFFHAPLIAPDT